MKVLAAEFVTSATGAPKGVPLDAPQISLAGRSNVGKSTLVNALCRRKIARTSAAPGKTRLANVYRVSLDVAGTRELYLVDLPGYGYARGGADSAQELRAVAEAYLTGERLRPERGAGGKPAEGRAPRESERGWGPASPEKSRHVLLLIDSRHPALDSDAGAHAWFASLGIEPHIVATKIDKLSRSERARNLRTLGDVFGTAALPVSAQSGEGLNELWQLIIRLAKNR